MHALHINKCFFIHFEKNFFFMYFSFTFIFFLVRKPAIQPKHEHKWWNWELVVRVIWIESVYSLHKADFFLNIFVYFHPFRVLPKIQRSTSTLLKAGFWIKTKRFYHYCLCVLIWSWISALSRRVYLFSFICDVYLRRCSCSNVRIMV